MILTCLQHYRLKAYTTGCRGEGRETDATSGIYSTVQHEYQRTLHVVMPLLSLLLFVFLCKTLSGGVRAEASISWSAAMVLGMRAQIACTDEPRIHISRIALSAAVVVEKPLSFQRAVRVVRR